MVTTPSESTTHQPILGGGALRRRREERTGVDGGDAEHDQEREGYGDGLHEQPAFVFVQLRHLLNLALSAPLMGSTSSMRKISARAPKTSSPSPIDPKTWAARAPRPAVPRAFPIQREASQAVAAVALAAAPLFARG